MIAIVFFFHKSCYLRIIYYVSDACVNQLNSKLTTFHFISDAKQGEHLYEVHYIFICKKATLAFNITGHICNRLWQLFIIQNSLTHTLKWTLLTFLQIIKGRKHDLANMLHAGNNELCRAVEWSVGSPSWVIMTPGMARLRALLGHCLLSWIR